MVNLYAIISIRESKDHPPLLNHPVTTMVTDSSRALTVKVKGKKNIIIEEPVMTDTDLHYYINFMILFTAFSVTLASFPSWPAGHIR